MSQNKVEYFVGIVLKKSEYSNVFGIFERESVYGMDMISCMPVETAKTIEKAEAKIKLMIKKNKTKRYVIAKFLEEGYGEKKIKNEKKLKTKQFAVFTFPGYGLKDKVYFWGIVEGFNKSIAYKKIEKSGFWHLKLSRNIFVNELKDGKLIKNYFPRIPILTPYEPNYKGGTIKNVKIVPINNILP